MDIRINITNEDILSNPNIIDGVKALGQMLTGGEKAATTSKTATGVARTTESYIEEPKEEAKNEKPQEEVPEYTIEQVRKALGDLSKAKGASVAKGILKEFGVSKVTDLKETDYHGVMFAVKAVG